MSRTTLTMGAGSASVLATYKENVGIQVNSGHSAGVRIYPNPAVSEFRLSLNMEEHTELRLSLWDLSGRRVQEGFRVLHLDPGYRELILPVDKLTTGAYTLKLSVNGRVYSELLMVH